MLNLFNQKPSTLFEVQTLGGPSINFEPFVRGIDNVHIDVHLSPDFTDLCTRLSYELLDEHSSSKRRAIDQPSPGLRTKLDVFNANYTSMLTAAIHHAKEGKRVNFVQLFQIAVIKFVLTTVRTQAEQLSHKLRKATLKESSKKLNLSEQLAWFNRHKNNLLDRITQELFEQIYHVESDATIIRLRQSLLGITWTLPEKMLSNPLLQNQDSPDVLMKNYVLLFQDAYSFDHLIDKLLDEVAYLCQVQIAPCTDQPFIDQERMTDIHLSWKDVPANIDILFNLQETQNALENAKSPNQQAALTNKLRYQRLANKMLEQNLRQLIVSILAAYETPRLYEHYAKRLKPELLYQALCNKIDIPNIALKLKIKNHLKLKPLQPQSDKPLSINELTNAKKRVARLAQNPDNHILRQFLTDFITYQRDLKYHRLIHEAMESINLRTEDTLYEFLEEDKYISSSESICSHLIVKANLRGITAMKEALSQRGLDPATHLNRHFFNPMKPLIEKFGAEKLLIEENVVMFSFFEYQNQVDESYLTARACGLAKNLLAVLHKQNEAYRVSKLPELELGIAICYSPKSPKFLYEGDKIISPLLEAADELLSCSWKLRCKYAEQSKLFTQVMVFQFEDKTLCYNINGIELDSAAFQKLQSEIATLRHFKIRLSGDKHYTRFYVGSYPDANGQEHGVVIREDQIKKWIESSDNYPLTTNLYYEVVTNQQIIDSLIS
ncbi:MAG: hypothetical protein ABFS56_07515 [Pseudomonadota bacterium]